MSFNYNAKKKKKNRGSAEFLALVLKLYAKIGPAQLTVYLIDSSLAKEIIF